MTPDSLSSASSVSASASASSLTFLVHPLVVLSIADHYTRALHQPMSDEAVLHLQAGKKPRVFGLLFGTQMGRSVHITETVEAYYRLQSDTPLFEWQALQKDVELFSASYCEYECLGWYCTAAGEGSVGAVEMDIQKQMCRFSERPIMLMLDTSAEALQRDGRELPVRIFEETMHVLNEVTNSELIRSEFTIDSDEGERIALFYCAKLMQANSDEGEIVPHLMTLHKAVTSLHERLQIIQSFLKMAHRGEICTHHAILREIKALMQSLPIGSDLITQSVCQSEVNDGLLLTQLSMVTSAIEKMKGVRDKHIALHAKEIGRSFGGHGPTSFGITSSASISRRSSLHDE